MIAHIDIIITKSMQEYDVLDIGYVPKGLIPIHTTRTVVLMQGKNYPRILCFRENGSIDLWSWSDPGIVIPNQGRFMGVSTYFTTL